LLVRFLQPISNKRHAEAHCGKNWIFVVKEGKKIGSERGVVFDGGGEGLNCITLGTNSARQEERKRWRQRERK